MLILGKSLPYLQNAIASGLDSVNQGIIQTTQNRSIEALDTVTRLFSAGEANAQGLFETQTQSRVSEQADFPDPKSFMEKQEGTGQMLTFLADTTFRAGSELNNFSNAFSQQFAQIQTELTPEQVAGLNQMRCTVGRMSSLQQSLDAQFHTSRLVSGLLQSNLLQKAPDLMSLPFKPADPIFDAPPVAAKPHRVFVRDGSDVNEVDMNDVGQYRYFNPDIMNCIGAVARQDPKLIKNMIRENDDGTYTVILKLKSSDNPPQYKDWPIKVTGTFSSVRESKTEIWPLLIEKALKQIGGFSSMKDTLSALTGYPTAIRPLNAFSVPGFADYRYSEMKNDFDSGKAIVLEASEKEGEWVKNEEGTLIYNGRGHETFTVGNVYTDKDGEGWVELHYAGIRPAWLPANPIPFEDLAKFAQRVYVSQAHSKGAEFIQAESTNITDNLRPK